MDPPSAGKTRIRKQILEHLRALSPAERERRSRALRQRLAVWLGHPESRKIAIYASLPHEVDLIPLLKEFPRHSYYFPRCLPDRSMIFHRVSDPATQMRAAAMGILEPLAHMPVCPADAFTLVLVPGVAFTPEGDRLGYGGGYYDRYLPGCTHAELAALAFREQICAQLPTEAHDARIPHLIHD